MSEPWVNEDAVTKCVMCAEPMLTDGWVPIGTPEGPGVAHRVCMLREVLGGIGHHLDHEHFCVLLHDPDAGLDYHTSALMVDLLVQRKGVEHVVGA